MISPQIVEEIKYRNDIEDVISTYVSLKRAGSNSVGRCPFHSEKTPSFTVFSGSRSFYCFGCGAGGDVITFIMRSENLEYAEALRFLAKRAGIDIPEDEARGTQYSVSRDRLLQMNKDAGKFFFASLQNSKSAQDYCAKRGLSSALIRRFGIGYAPDSFDALTKHLKSKGYSVDEIKTGFLCSVREKNGRTYTVDIFRNRLMFPVIDVRGDIVAFGGRIIGEGEPKYLNSSDTPIFNKRRTLYALNFARTACAEQIILCEGYMDVVSLHGAGFTNAVASCGTAITPDQARLMKKYSASAIISYDADEAGQRAADKAFTLLGEVGLDARLLKVENAKDPDEYIKKFGKESFARLLKNSRSRFEFKFGNILARNDIKTTDGRIKAGAESADMLSKIHSDVERDICMRQVCTRLEVPYESMKSDVARRIAANAKKEKKAIQSEVLRSAEGYGDRVNPDRIHNIGASGAEDAIIGILANYPELISEASGGDIKLTPEDFFTELNRRFYSKMLEYGKSFDIGLLGEDFTPDEISRISRFIASRSSLTDNSIGVIKKCADKLRDSRDKDSLSLDELLSKKRSKLKKDST